jgi:arginase family enzyme
MDLSVFFEPVSRDLFEGIKGTQLGSRCWASGPAYPDWQKADIVLLGMQNEEQPKGMAAAVRPYLYALSLPHENLAIADLGNLKLKDSLEASYDALAYVMEHLMDAGKTVLLVADDPSSTFAQYISFANQDRWINYVHVGPKFHLLEPETAPDNDTFNQRIFIHEPNSLFSYTNLGYQRYFVGQEELASLKDLQFSSRRYGELAGTLEVAEPYLREANMLSMEMSAIRQSECPASAIPSPGGFSALEACQLARYAGISPQLNNCSIHGLNMAKNDDGQSAHLAATMLWYFMEGYYHRPDTIQPEDLKQMRRYNVQLRAAIEQINFYYDSANQHWWMEVPMPSEIGKVKPQSRLVACSEEDYQTARHDEIPGRWWKAYHKLEKLEG